MPRRHLIVTIEITPLGKAILRLARLLADADPALIPVDIMQAARDVRALDQERSDE